jgi:glyoxylase-like metal-dependent hydrolase (beta-lactamase superfamily II)
MIEITGKLQYDAWQAHEVPPVECVRPLVWSVPVDCARFPVRYTFSYLVSNSSGQFIIIDPGYSSDEGVRQLREGIVGVGLDPRDLLGVVVTHFHADHMGGAHELLSDSSGWLAMHAAEVEFFEDWPAVEKVLKRDELMCEGLGVPLTDDRGARLDADEYRSVMPQVLPDRFLQDGDRIPLPGRNLVALWTPGHTAGHLSIVDHDNDLVFCGDHVLPRITPNVSAYQHDLGHDSLGDYLSSLEKISAFDAYEACPAHEYRFRGLAQRAEELAQHLFERQEEVRNVFDELPNATTWQVACRLSWKRGWDGLDGPNLRAALGETQAHVNRLTASESLDSRGNLR